MTPLFLLIVLCCGVSALLVGAFFIMRTRTPWLNLLKIAWGIAVFTLSAYLNYFLFESSSFAFLAGIFWVVVTRIILRKRLQWRDLEKDIQLLDALNWSWKQAGRGFIVGFMYVFIPASLFALFLEIVTGWLRYEFVKIIFGQQADFLASIFYLVIFIAFLLGILWGGFSGVQTRIIERKSRPNAGIWLTLRNGVIIGSSFGIFITIFFVLIILFLINPEYLRSWPSFDSITYILPILLPGFLWFFAFVILAIMLNYGAIDFLYHFFLRVTLVRQGHMPRQYAPFLDHASKLLVLRKVGGGYIFIHRLVLEHFALLQPHEEIQVKPLDTPASRPSEVRAKIPKILRLKPNKLMVFAMILGMITGALITFSTSTANEPIEERPAELSPQIPTPSPTPALGVVSVVVAKRYIPQDTIITVDDVEYESFPDTNIFIRGGYAFSDIETVLGRELRIPVKEGQPIIISIIKLPGE